MAKLAQPKLWWINNIHQNKLAGIPDDPDHPLMSKDEFIRYCLMYYTLGRTGFNQMMEDPDRPYVAVDPDDPADPANDNTLLYPEEKARLNAIIARYPIIRNNIIMPDQDVTDISMASLNSQNIQQCKPGRLRPRPLPRRGMR